jgi:hypothetical protein
VINLSADPVSRYEPSDGWGGQRIWIAGACGAMLAGSRWILDFWPLGARGSLGQALRTLFNFSRVLLLLPLAGFVVVLLIVAGVAWWHGHFRRGASSIFAIAAIPACFLLVAKGPIFDPWLWYAIASRTRFEALATNGPLSNEPKYALLEIRDVATSMAGIGPNHFVALIYDESDAIGLEPPERPAIWRTRSRSLWPALGPISIPKGRRLYGHFFRVDDFE